MIGSALFVMFAAPAPALGSRLPQLNTPRFVVGSVLKIEPGWGGRVLGPGAAPLAPARAVLAPAAAGGSDPPRAAAEAPHAHVAHEQCDKTGDVDRNSVPDSCRSK